MPGVAVVLSVLTAGDSRLGLMALTMYASVFFIAQWLEYHTGVLPTAWGPIGITEVELCQILGVIAAGIAGPDRLLEFFGSPIPGMSGWHYRDIVMVVWASGCAAICFMGALHGLRESAKTGKASVALMQLVPPIMLSVFSACWSTPAWQNEHRVISLITGLQFWLLSMQVIVFSMSKQAFPLLQWSVLAYATIVCFSHVMPITRLQLEVYLTVLLAYLLCWISSTMVQITTKLQIKAFSISSTKKA
eukprot:gnl/MRDRNA2_/MRDRNA2_69522_c0_seq2.p1 gnl/MRDRNA2_/MRDRNA2_69522_c0~~gnl/MRDRNA2_/MRDRNA2_69522_c0_seq2.p1  ORF type:complete len:279 (-),score=29.27 gnl/MRDRNA2_/MRDRNA2_69522_c0_seq2:465-1205(-)